MRAYWDADAKAVFCLDHVPSSKPGLDAPRRTRGQPDGSGWRTQVTSASATDPAPLDLGEAGRSAQREHDRRSLQRERRVRQRHPVIGGFLLAVSDDPRSTRAWANGAAGERAVGRCLDRLANLGVITLHDRRVPGSSANIDHIAVAPSGVYVIDAKYRETGRVEQRTSGSIFRPGPPQLWVGKRNCTPLVAKMAGQLNVVMSALEGCAPAVSVPIRPMLAFVNAEWRFFASAIDIAGVLVVWPNQMAKIVSRPGSTTPDAVAAIAHHLASRLRSA